MKRGARLGSPSPSDPGRRLGEKSAPGTKHDSSQSGGGRAGDQGRTPTDRRTRHNQSETRNRAQIEHRSRERRNAERPPTPLEIRLRDFTWMTAFARECESAGGQLWIHGGALRDPERASDLDLMVPGLDEQGVMRALRRAGVTGRRATHHPVIRVFRGPIPVEISAEPQLTTPESIVTDVHSRDFTVNAAAQRYRGQFQLQAALRREECVEHPRHDQDLSLKIMRPCLNGTQAVERHPLLLARAVRLCAQLGFSPSAGLISMAHIAAPSVRAAPMRRRAEELMRALNAPNWTCALPLLGAELLSELVVIPGFQARRSLDSMQTTGDGVEALALWARSEGLSPAQMGAWSARGAWTVDAQLRLLTGMTPRREELSGWMLATQAYGQASDHPTWQAQHAGTGLRLARQLDASLTRSDLDAMHVAQTEAAEQYPQADDLAQVK